MSLYEPDSKTMAVELIDVAIRDYEASKILFEKDLYPQAIFLLQQSLEKAIKAILLKLGIAEAKELERRIGHRIIMNFLDLIVYRALSQLIILLGEGLACLELLRNKIKKSEEMLWISVIRLGVLPSINCR